ncbi:MAG TPA: hydantoinase/oxoprolinase family protein [Candidatus Aquilonibacter sp.]|nr:hydantoinase/oxoprolinase family protein [Candidatus Aquilonibacter sp.]
MDILSTRIHATFGLKLRVAVDTGGTFTDCVYLDDGALRVLKVRSTPDNPAQAILDCLARIDSTDGFSLRHGTTVGTNAMLERNGARVAFITTAGFEDTIAIGRQTRPKLYDFFGPAPACLIPSELRFGIEERVSTEGEILMEPSKFQMELLRRRLKDAAPEAIALSLLFSFLRPDNELRVENALRSLGIPISVSHRLLPEFREYERASTIVVNAYLTPKMKNYLVTLETEVVSRYRDSAIEVMQSSGGVIALSSAAEEPVRTILSGPAGGAIGASRVAAAAGFSRIIGLDIGGTSTDVFLTADQSELQLISDARIGGVPVGVPMLDIHTVGAGGGSIASFDSGGLLRVGPESAGADPGPVCFGNGDQPTVTDANLLLGRLAADYFAGGTVEFHEQRARERFADRKGSLATVEQFAAGILRIAESHMQRAIRIVSVERGHDPRQFTLVAFGGGGPLHACALARLLDMPRVLVPVLPGALSALGILLADSVSDVSRTVMLPQAATGDLEERFRDMEETCCPGKSSCSNVLLERSFDLRYRGEGYELNVPYCADTLEAFHVKHEQRYGFADRDRDIEIVNLRLRLRKCSEEFTFPQREPREGNGSQAMSGEQQVYFDGAWQRTNIYNRDRLHPGDTIRGPALIAEYTSTTVLPPDCILTVDRWSNLLIEVS